MSALAWLPTLAEFAYDATSTALEFTKLYEDVAAGRESIAALAQRAAEDVALATVKGLLDAALVNAIQLELDMAKADAEARQFIYDHPDAPPQTLPGGGTPE